MRLGSWKVRMQIVELFGVLRCLQKFSSMDTRGQEHLVTQERCRIRIAIRIPVTLSVAELSVAEFSLLQKPLLSNSLCCRSGSSKSKVYRDVD